MSDLDGRRELLEAPDGTSPPMPIRNPLVPLAAAMETLNRKADFIIDILSFLLALAIGGIAYIAVRPDGAVGGLFCGLVAGAAWYLIERHARKI